MIYLPIAEYSVNIYHLFLVGGFAGFIAGLCGLGGGIISSPFLIFYGLPSPIVVGTASFQLLGTSIAASLTNFRDNKIDYFVGMNVFVGGFFGSFLGTRLLKLAMNIGNIDFIISISFIFLMILILIPMIVDVFFNVSVIQLEKHKIKYEFEDFFVQHKFRFNFLYFHSSITDIKYNVLYLFLIGILIGVVSSVLGIGGNMILIPAMTYLFGMPFEYATATALFSVLPLSLVSLYFHSSYGNVDFTLGSIVLLLSAFTVKLGLYCQSIMKPVFKKISLIIVISFILILFVFGLFKEPANLITIN